MQTLVAKRLRWVAPATLLALAACSSSDSDEIRDGWRATQRVLDDGVERVQVQPREGSLDPETSDSVDVSLRVDCPAGGTAQLDALVAEDTISLSLEFGSCKSEGVVIDGGMAMSLTWTDSETSFGMNLRYEGSLEWSGAVEMTCDIDMRVEISSSFDPETFVGNHQVSIKGHVCGEPADSVLSEEDFAD